MEIIFTEKIKSDIKKLLRAKRLTLRIDIVDNIEFLKQFEYKFNLKVFVDGELYYKSKIEETDFDIVPLDLKIDMSNGSVKIVRNEMFVKKIVSEVKGYYNHKKEIVESNEIIEVKKALKIDSVCKNQFDIIEYYLLNKFDSKMQLDKLSFEENWFMNRSYGQTNFLRTTKEIKKGYVYDINSEHNFILSNKFYFPMRQGTTRMLKSIGEINYSKIGLYLVTIEFNEKTKYFKPIGNDDYLVVSSYMLALLNKTKTPFEMKKLDNVEFNCIEYDMNDCVSGHRLFHDDFEKLYKLKKNKNTIASDFMHKIMGYMAKREKSDVQVKTDKELKFYKKPTFNKYGPFRVKQFIYDLCRLSMYELYIKSSITSNNKIYRIKADSIILKNKLPETLLGEEMGKMKYEGYFENQKFKHVNDCTYKNYLQK